MQYSQGACQLRRSNTSRLLYPEGETLRTYHTYSTVLDRHLLQAFAQTAADNADKSRYWSFLAGHFLPGQALRKSLELEQHELLLLQPLEVAFLEKKTSSVYTAMNTFDNDQC
jgi:hypothetical protein